MSWKLYGEQIWLTWNKMKLNFKHNLFYKTIELLVYGLKMINFIDINLKEKLIKW